MKITKKRLKQIISEEVRYVLQKTRLSEVRLSPPDDPEEMGQYDDQGRVETDMEIPAIQELIDELVPWYEAEYLEGIEDYIKEKLEEIVHQGDMDDEMWAQKLGKLTRDIMAAAKEKADW